MWRLHNTHEQSIDTTAAYTQRVARKPAGLWYAPNLAWHRWASSERPQMVGPRWHALELKPDNMALLKTPQDVMDFHSKYGTDRSNVDWSKVAKDYAGMEAMPYHKFHPDFGEYPHSKEPGWYPGLDVPSGVVWNLKDGLVRSKQVSLTQLRAAIQRKRK